MFLVDHNKIQPISFSYDIIKYTIQEYSKSIPLRISKLRRKLLKKKKQTLSLSQKRDQEIRLFPFLFEKKTKRSATHPLLKETEKQPRDKAQENWARETMLKKKIEGVTVPRPPPTWLCPRHERKLRGQTTNHFHPGPRVLFVLFPTPWVPPLFPNVPPPNDLHAANRQNEPIIAAFVIFPSTSSFFSSSSRRRETRIVIVFPICIDWIPRSSPARFFLSRRTGEQLSFCRCPELRSLLIVALLLLLGEWRKKRGGRFATERTLSRMDLLDFAFWTDGFLFVSCSFSLRPESWEGLPVLVVENICMCVNLIRR